jgi:hypothetical protein
MLGRGAFYADPGSRPRPIVFEVAFPPGAARTGPPLDVGMPEPRSGVVVAERDTYEEAMKDVRSARAFHLETFGPDSLDVDPPVWRHSSPRAAVGS